VADQCVAVVGSLLLTRFQQPINVSLAYEAIRSCSRKDTSKSRHPQPDFHSNGARCFLVKQNDPATQFWP
jgi:hypothetical protein